MRTLKPLAGILAAVAVSAVATPPADAAPPIRFSGQLSGLVTDGTGKPQSGAVVLLLNRQEHLLQQSATASDGTFSFPDLFPDLYTIRVTMASFMPAGRERIAIKAGMRSLIAVNVSRIFSTIQVVSTVPAPGGLMSDDWKWVLRSDNAARPILRFLPDVEPPPSLADSTHAGMFSDSRAMIRFSASDGPEISADGQADLGTQFAFATSVLGTNRVQIAGDVGYGATGTPSAAFRTTYSRSIHNPGLFGGLPGGLAGGGVNPSVSLTMRQIFLPMHGLQSYAATDGTPAVRTMAVSFEDKMQVSDALSVEYGAELDTVSFLDRLHYFSPYAHVTYALNQGTIGQGVIDFGWTSGNSRPELGISPGDATGDLQRDLTALSVMPRVSLYDGNAKVQRGDDYELGLSERFGSRVYRVEGYAQHISNTALMVAEPTAGLFAGDLLPDFFSNAAWFNLGNLDNFGYSASVTQELGTNYRIALVYGSTGVLQTRPEYLSGSGSGAIESADDLRGALFAGHRQFVTLRGSGVVRPTGTRFIASYQFTDYGAAMPAPELTTALNRSEPGLNVIIRQPLNLISGATWRVEATAELRNLLAQGYLPLTGPGGERIVLVNMPRSVRGGLAFVF